MEQEEIKKQAKKIMDDFAKALEKSKVKEETVFLERDEDRRQEKDEACDNDFREIMLENAEKIDARKEDFIVGEKGGWEE